jgi:hypothetical protein
VPTDIAASGQEKNPITKSLKTRDLSKAEVDRRPLVAHYAAHFEVTRGNRQWTLEDIEKQADAVFTAALDDVDAFRNDVRFHPDFMEAVAELEVIQSGKGVYFTGFTNAGDA